MFCPVYISVTLHCRITKFFCSVSKDVFIVQRYSHFFKMSNFGSFGAFFLQFWFPKLSFSTCRNLKLFWTIIILTEVVQQKNQNSNFPKNFEVLAKKPLLKFEFCPVHISVTIHCRIAGVFCCVGEDIPIVRRWGHFFKMLDFGSFFGKFWFQKLSYFLYYRSWKIPSISSSFLRPAFVNNTIQHMV